MEGPPTPSSAAHNMQSNEINTSSVEEAESEDQVSVSFRESRISIAVDVSGSTYGSTLEAEKTAIKSVCSLIPRNMHSNITILPWCDSANKPRTLTELNTLDSDGGTDPRVFLMDAECRRLLQGSDFWFLMTDGIIEEYVVRSFISRLTAHGIHGKACIISIFGDNLNKPSDCNVSVGLSVFAVSPHVAFLYSDVNTSKTYVLSTKGCFSSLLPAGKHNPVLQRNTRWEDLPQVSYENLTRVSVPPAQDLARDEVALQENFHVNIQDLLSKETIDHDMMRRIMLNEDNMKTIAITSKLRGESDKLETWLDRVDKELDENDQAFADQISRMLEGPGSSVIARDYALDNELSTSYPDIPAPPTVSKEQSQSYSMRRSSHAMRSISESDLDEPENSISISSRVWECDSTGGGPQRRGTNRSQRWSSTNAYDALHLENTGFLRPDQKGEYFSGQCPECQMMDRLLTLVLLSPPNDISTKNFPSVGSESKLMYPLTMGNYPEVDIISNLLVCDHCSAYMARVGATPSKRAILAVLPLVSYRKNQDAWLQTLFLATERRFARPEIPLVFLSILFTKLERLLSVEGTEQSALNMALRWECKMIQSEVVLQAEAKITSHQLGPGMISEVLLHNFRNSLNTDMFPLLLRYPLDGFIVANAALSNSKYNKALSGPKRQSVVLLRFLYHLVENFYSYGKENGEVQLHALKTLVLLLDDPRAARSLFRWDTVRFLSQSFKSLEDFKKHLQNMTKTNLYRLSISVRELVPTPLLSDAGLADFRRLGVLFSGIESQAGHAIAVFLHFLMRLEVDDCSPEVLFQTLRRQPEVNQALEDPESLSALAVEQLTKGLLAL